MNDRINLILRIRTAFEVATLFILQLILMIVIALAISELCALLYQYFATQVRGERSIESMKELHNAVQRAFAGVLLVLLGLELFETMKTYFTEHRVKVQVILIVAIIAVARHLMLFDFEHESPGVLAGTGVVIAALTGGYFLVGRSARSHGDSSRQ